MTFVFKNDARKAFCFLSFSVATGECLRSSPSTRLYTEPVESMQSNERISSCQCSCYVKVVLNGQKVSVFFLCYKVISYNLSWIHIISLRLEPLRCSMSCAWLAYPTLSAWFGLSQPVLVSLVVHTVLTRLTTTAKSGRRCSVVLLQNF